MQHKKPACAKWGAPCQFDILMPQKVGAVFVRYFQFLNEKIGISTKLFPFYIFQFKIIRSEEEELTIPLAQAELPLRVVHMGDGFGTMVHR